MHMMGHTSFVMSSSVKRIDHTLRKRDQQRADKEDKNGHALVDGL